MALQPDARSDIDRSSAAPFLLRLYWRQNRALDPWEFSVAPPADTSNVTDYASILPSNIRQQSVQVYTWPNCTLRELAGLFVPILPSGAMPYPAVGTRLVFKLIFPDTRATVIDGNRGKWIDKPLGSVVIGGNGAEPGGDVDTKDKTAVEDSLDGDADKSLAEARFVIGDYVACSIYPPGADGRVVPTPSQGSRAPPGRDYGARGPPPPRDNMYGGGDYGRGGGGYRGGYGGRGGGGPGSAPPPGDWRRGERPPSGYNGPPSGYNGHSSGYNGPPSGYNGPRRGGYRGRGGRPY